MPELCRFHGIVIQMYFGDHGPPHFHALYGAQNVPIDIDTLQSRAGRLPARQHASVLRWARLRQSELSRAWQLTQQDQDPGEIRPLD